MTATSHHMKGISRAFGEGWLWLCHQCRDKVKRLGGGFSVLNSENFQMRQKPVRGCKTKKKKVTFSLHFWHSFVITNNDTYVFLCCCTGACSLVCRDSASLKAPWAAPDNIFTERALAPLDTTFTHASDTITSHHERSPGSFRLLPSASHSLDLEKQTNNQK